MPLGFRETYKATAGQKVFMTPQPYVTGSGTLYVYLNGLTCGIGAHLDYQEIDEKFIEFNYELQEGDLVTLATSTLDKSLGIDVVGVRNALFPLYGSGDRLKNNQLYEINLMVNGKKINWKFSSRFSPMHSNAQVVRLVTGNLLSEVTDEQINGIIYHNSKEIVAVLAALDEENSTTTAIGSVHKEWVKFKTCLDLVNAIYLTISGQKGSISKSIGQLRIEKSIELPYLSDMLKYFQEQFKKYDMSVTKPIISRNFVKAGTSEYPITTARRSF